MSTSREEIKGWAESAKKNGASHLIVVCDTFDWEDYPVEVMPGEDVKAKVAEYSDPNKMQKVMEVYSMKLDLQKQLTEQRAWHLD